MKDQKKEKKDIWLYAALLFMSAFVILLITAYSQIKLNKSVDEYESKIQGEMKQKYVYQYDLKRALNENEELKKSVNSLQKKIEELENDYSSLYSQIKKEDDKLKEAIEFYSILSAAESEYGKGNIVKCAQLLHSKLNKDILGPEARKKYDYLFSKSNYRAGLSLYNDGYRLFREKNYSAAIEKFLASYELTQNDYYSDDCLYFASASYYYSGNNNKAAEKLETLLKNHPESTYRNEALLLKKKIEQKQKTAD